MNQVKDGLFEAKLLDAATFESERPVIYSVKEIDDATCNFDDSMKIGEGGYGSVYVGTLKERVW